MGTGWQCGSVVWEQVTQVALLYSFKDMPMASALEQVTQVTQVVSLRTTIYRILLKLPHVGMRRALPSKVGAKTCVTCVTCSECNENK